MPLANTKGEDKEFRKGDLVAKGSLIRQTDIFALEPNVSSRDGATIHGAWIQPRIEEKDVEIGTGSDVEELNDSPNRRHS